MDIRLTLQKGELEIEIEAEKKEDYKSEFLDIIRFVEENTENLPNLEDSASNTSDDTIETTVTTEKEAVSETEPESESSLDQSDVNPLEEFATKINIDFHKLDEIVDIDPELEDIPYLIVETDEFGETRQARQLHAMLILLVVWNDCYEESRVSTSDLKDALELSGIDSDKLTNVYHNIDQADSYFDRQGRGASASISLTRPGSREARNRLRELTDD